MKERPILFSGEMVRAILDGRKTQTRRVVNRIASRGKITEFQEIVHAAYRWTFRDLQMRWHEIRHEQLLERCPYGKPGDRLWVRETFRYIDQSFANDSEIQYKADGSFKTIPDDIYSEDPVFSRLIDWTAQNPRKWKPSIHMPRWASRINLDVTSVRVERLKDISDSDILSEGIVRPDLAKGAVWNPRGTWRELWTSINGPESWNANPWVWVVEFNQEGTAS